MPRISAEHEQQVRERIVRAATAVFAEKGYHGATIADVVARSGLSVGAIYTHFRGKDELFLLACDATAERSLDELGVRLASLTSTPERLAAALAYYVETIDSFEGEPGQVSLIRAWAEADVEPGVRDMLVRRRERLVGAATLLLHEGDRPRRSARLAGRRRLRPRVHRTPRWAPAPAHRGGARLSAGRRRCGEPG